jgi:hypothetical protein
MLSFLNILKQDSEFYSLFMAEAEKRGHYSATKLRNQTLDFARKDYFDSFIGRENKQMI